ncbi:SAM-dependent methyltransferase, partial [Enterococcus faecium]
QVFDEVYPALQENGRFLFDVHSTYQVDEVFPEYSYQYQGDNFAFLWDSYPGSEKHSIEHYLTVFVEEQEGSGRFSREDELHQE